MTEFTINEQLINDYITYMRQEEKSAATIEKYKRDLYKFYDYLPENKHLKKEYVIEYKNILMTHYSISSVNSFLAALNCFFKFAGHYELCVKSVKKQKNLFCEDFKILSMEEYKRLVTAAEQLGKERLSLIIQTIASTGIRISELEFITVDAVQTGRARINMKGKIRVVILPKSLCLKLAKYCLCKNIELGAVFKTSVGNNVDRCNIWSEMKKLCAYAAVDSQKVFPHNLRHLFARTYYSASKDLNRLADILGHSSIETSRIYTMTSAESLEKSLEELGLVI